MKDKTAYITIFFLLIGIGLLLIGIIRAASGLIDNQTILILMFVIICFLISIIFKPPNSHFKI